MRRLTLASASLLLVCAAVACQTVDDPFPAQSAINVTITDSMVANQRFPLPNPQIALWTIDEISVSNLTNVQGTFEFLRVSPCTYQLNALAPLSLSSVCRTSGLSLIPGPSTTGKVRIAISSLELRAAARPDLAAGSDPDGDGIPNISDNCPIVFNPDQANVNAAQETFFIGDACSDANDEGALTIPDQDIDGVKDTADNCLWYPNPLVGDETTPPDQNRDGIGDACERVAPVIFLPNGRLTLECDVTFVPRPSLVAGFVLDFGRSGVLTCDAAFTGCALNTSELKLQMPGTETTFPCVTVP